MNKQTSECCPNCKTPGLIQFYELQQVPVHSVLLLPTREEAMDYPKGDITLGFCPACGFVSNMAFQPDVHEYSFRYEATQGYSSTFNAFHRRLAQNLIDRYQLRNKSIIEIGCGQGEFLALLCEMGGNRGVGFDPAYSEERSQVAPNQQITFIQDFYSEKYTAYQADFVCCKMTLEHIHQTANFLQVVKQSIGDQQDTVIFFQVPNGAYVFGEVAFWDIYYEHCSYFSKSALARLFLDAGFAVTAMWTDYDDQYLMIEAHPAGKLEANASAGDEGPAGIEQVINGFSLLYPQKAAAWRDWFKTAKANEKKVVLWGGGSKAVAFLSTLGITTEEIEYVVDINPYKAGTYIAGAGQEILNPDTLRQYQPDTVVVMNPVYCNEISQKLADMQLFPEVLSILSL